MKKEYPWIIRSLNSKDKWVFHQLEKVGYDKIYNYNFNDNGKYYLWVGKKHEGYELIVTISNEAQNKAEWRYPQSLNIHVIAYMNLHTKEGLKRLKEFEELITRRLYYEYYFEDIFANTIRGEKYDKF